MAMWANIARSYSYNPVEAIIKAYELEGSLGALAFDDQVELAKLGETIVQGGYLRTVLLAAKSISAEKLDVEDLAAITGKFSGDVYVGGDIVVGGQGILSMFQFVSNGYNEGWGDFGIHGFGNYTRGRVSVPVSIPSNFTITNADIELQAMPVFYDDELDSENDGWKQSRNLRLYHSPGNDGYHYLLIPSDRVPPTWRSGTNITSSVLGVSSWNPPLAYSGTDSSNTQNKIQYIGGSIESYLTPGQTTTFYVETTDSPTQENAVTNVGMGRILVTVEGYASPKQ